MEQKISEILNNLMEKKGFRRKRDVADYFGVSPQALSLWIAKDQIPPKHLLKLIQEKESIQQQPGETQEDDQQEPRAVIDYLMRENIGLKNEIDSLKSEVSRLKTPSTKGDFIDRIISDSLLICGRISDGVITEVGGNWKDVLGYDDAQLVNRRYDREELIHPDELTRVQSNQEKLSRSESIAESRYSTIQRWKHAKTGEYIMLSMVWDVNVKEDRVVVVCKPIDGFVGEDEIIN